MLTPGTGLPRDEVIRKFPTDGMVTGVGAINGELFAEHDARCVVMAYDYTVLAGTQGAVNHPKTDRMLELAERWRRPVVLFAEGGGGRAGTGGKRDGGASTTGAGQGRSEDSYRPLDTPTFAAMARLSGPRAARRHHLAVLLRRQRVAARLLRRDHRHRRTRTSAWAARR